jgi:SAM-dependent methyltransferase
MGTRIGLTERPRNAARGRRRSPDRDGQTTSEVRPTDTREREWNASYERRENFLFHPHEEIIRFVSRHIRKRIGFDEFTDLSPNASERRVLDLGCGIGRHVIFAHQMGLNVYGVDLSPSAVREAIEWGRREGIADIDRRVVCNDLRELPWPDGYFDYVISHGVLDSMPFPLARKAIAEAARVMAPGALFYCDLIAGDDSSHFREFAGEEIVSTRHEQGTVQSYFNFEKIQRLAERDLEIVQAVLIKREDVLGGGYRSRYHLVLKKP